jgi:hypothetical protein
LPILTETRLGWSPTASSRLEDGRRRSSVGAHLALILARTLF